MKLEIISRHPVGNGHPTPLLFIHGMLHGAWCWEVHFLEYFARHGFAVHAVNLRGHGKSDGHERLRWTRIAVLSATSRAQCGSSSNDGKPWPSAF